MQLIENIRVLVLASILGANDFDEIDLNIVMASGINKEWFKDEAQRAMFEVMNVCYNGNISFDDFTIINYMKKTGIDNPEQIMLNVMSQSQVPQSIVMEHIATLKESYHRESLALLNIELTKMLSDSTLSSAAITQTLQNSIDDYSFLNKGSSTRRLSEVRKERKSKPPVVRIETEIPFIDTVLTDKKGNKGFRNEGLVFISGKKESGKTFILTRIIENISKTVPVMFGSMEFGEELYDENIEEQEQEGNFNGNIENIHTFDSLYSVSSIIAEIRLQHKLYGIKLVALDSMLRMTNDNEKLKTDEKRISEMFSRFGKLSKELKVPIIIIVQSSKEDLKSSVISVKGSMDADHEAYVWFHLVKSKPKEPNDEMRNVIWNKNKDTKKHPVQTLMFVPQTSDFYRVEVDEHGNAGKALDKYRKPPPKSVETVYEDIQTTEEDSELFEMPEF